VRETKNFHRWRIEKVTDAIYSDFQCMAELMTNEQLKQLGLHSESSKELKDIVAEIIAKRGNQET